MSSLGHRQSLSVSRTRLSCAFAALLVLACDNTLRGVEADTERAAASIEHVATTTAQGLGSDVERFKAEARAKLDALDVKLNGLTQGTQQEVEEAKASARRKIAEAREGVEKAGAATKSDWETTRKRLDESLAELGKDINHTLDGLGDNAEKKLQ
jgi:predicted small secreted protein